MSDTDTGPKAISSPDENRSEFSSIVERFGERVEEIEIAHKVGGLTIKRTLRIGKSTA